MSKPAEEEKKEIHKTFLMQEKAGKVKKKKNEKVKNKFRYYHSNSAIINTLQIGLRKITRINNKTKSIIYYIEETYLKAIWKNKK